MIDGKNFLDQWIKNNLKTYDKNGKVTIAWGDDSLQIIIISLNAIKWW